MPTRSNLVTLSADADSSVSMLGAVVDLNGHVLNLVVMDGHGVFNIIGPGSFTGLLDGVLSADQSATVTYANGTYSVGESSGGGGIPVLSLTEFPEDTRVPTKEKRALEFAGTTITGSGNLKLRFTSQTGTVEAMVAVGEGDFGSDIASKVFEAWGLLEESGVLVEWEFGETTVYWEALATGRDVFFAVEILEENAVANNLPHSRAIAVGSGVVAGTAGLLHQDARVTIDEDVSVWRCVQASGGYKWIPVSGAYFWNRDELRWERGFVGGRTIQTEQL